MIWTIIGIIILGIFCSLASQGKQIQRERNMKERQEARKIRQFQREVNEDPDLIKRQWKKRIKELDIDLSKAVRVRYYLYYYDNKTTDKYVSMYLWAEEGAIASFKDYKDMYNVNVTSSPLEWDVIRIELVNIEGVYKRKGITILQWKDGTQFGYAEEDGDKIKEIYKEAKNIE